MLLARIRKVYQAISTRIKPDLLLKKLLSFKNKKRFSTYLVTTVVMLATLSVFVILIALYGYFGKRVESEFREKILAEKGQVEIILNNRISDISGMLKDLGSDNIIRVTVMLDGKSSCRNGSPSSIHHGKAFTFLLRNKVTIQLFRRPTPNYPAS